MCCLVCRWAARKLDGFTVWGLTLLRAVGFGGTREYVSHWRWHIFCEDFLHGPAASAFFFCGEKKKDFIVAPSINVTRPIFLKCKFLCFMTPFLHKPGGLFNFFADGCWYFERCCVCLSWFHHLCVSCSAVFSSLRPHGLQPASLLCPRDSPGKNTGVGCHALFPGIFLTQGSNPGSLHCW